MLNNFLQLIVRRPSVDVDLGFVREVHVSKPSPRDLRTERLLLGGWLLIVAKSWLVIWAVEKYHVPINPLWVIVPTVMFALVCTAAYFRGE
jgi:hypothetical protein